MEKNRREGEKKKTQKYKEKTSTQKIAASEDDMFQDISCDTNENLAEIGSEDVKSYPTFLPTKSVNNNNIYIIIIFIRITCRHMSQVNLTFILTIIKNRNHQQ